MWGPGMDDGKRLNKFASLLQQGIEQKKAFQQAFGSFADMDKALKNYLSKFSFQTGVLSNFPQIDEKSFSSHTLSLAETKAELSGFHLWTHDVSGARSLAEQAIKDDPKVGLAHEVLGFANFNEGKDAEALSEFSQAYAMDPTLSLSLFAKSMMSPLATSNAPADQDALRDALSKVVGLNGEFAPAYVQLARLAWRQNNPQLAYQLSRKAEQLEPTRAGYHIQSGQFLLHMGKGADAAVFAKYVADRWPGPDHDEAVELWDAIPADQRTVTGQTAGASLEATQIEEAWIQATQIKDTQIMQGRLTEVSCSPAGHSSPDHSSPEPGMIFTISHDGKSLRFRRTGPFGAGFSDTIWYGEDHFSFCHHLEGMRAVIHYKPSADPSYAGDVAEVDIRDDLPEPLPKAPAAASASAQQ
jgi:tetratricopeptide (TPR) repeat protein